MGTDAKLYISPKFDEYDVQDALINMGKKEVSIKGCDGLFVQVSFKSNLHDHNRMLWMFANGGEESIGIPSHTLSFSSDEESIEVLEKLAETFGGILQPKDCAEDYQAFQRRSADMEFMLKRFMTKMVNEMPFSYESQKAMFVKYLLEEK